jgi:hypothetical protein
MKYVSNKNTEIPYRIIALVRLASRAKLLKFGYFLQCFLPPGSPPSKALLMACFTLLFILQTSYYQYKKFITYIYLFLLVIASISCIFSFCQGKLTWGRVVAYNYQKNGVLT